MSIGRPAPKIHWWTIYFCRWGFGWIDKAQCFRSARWFGAAGSSPDFSRVFHDMALLGFVLNFLSMYYNIVVPRPTLQLSLYRNPTQASNFGSTFDQLFLRIFLSNFHTRCPSTFFHTVVQKVKNDPKLKSRDPAFKKPPSFIRN